MAHSIKLSHYQLDLLRQLVEKEQAQTPQFVVMSINERWEDLDEIHAILTQEYDNAALR